MSRKRFMTSESVTPGHPDKLCDLISDTILDYTLMKEPNARVAIEVSMKYNTVYIFGESSYKLGRERYIEIAKEVIKSVGYDTSSLNITVEIWNQSPEICSMVDNDTKIAAGDQGIMFGYATNETENFMPMPSYLAHKLAKIIYDDAKVNNFTGLGPDAKTQVTVEYNEDGFPLRIQEITVSASHNENMTVEDVRKYVKGLVIRGLNEQSWMEDGDTYINVNENGSFVKHGPQADAGTTGRKIVVDAYGSAARVGGGAMSTKDATKVDRSGAYFARYIAKSIVAHNLADKIEVQLAYTIGQSNAVNIEIDTFGTNNVLEDTILDIIIANFDTSVDNIIKELNLTAPIFSRTTNFGHFGKSDMTWEKIKPLTGASYFNVVAQVERGQVKVQ